MTPDPSVGNRLPRDGWHLRESILDLHVERDCFDASRGRTALTFTAPNAPENAS